MISQDLNLKLWCRHPFLKFFKRVLNNDDLLPQSNTSRIGKDLSMGTMGIRLTHTNEHPLGLIFQTLPIPSQV